MEILVITGLSGSGKSQAASYLEDMGYYTVDNLPAEMMVKFAEFCVSAGGRYDRVALVYDIRAGEPFAGLTEVMTRIRAMGVTCHMLFLEASSATIINRYKETRRTHPLSVGGKSIEDSVRAERELLQPIRDHADFILDTTSLSTAKLRSEIGNLFGGQSDRMGLNVNVLSFGFKHGIPIEADLVFDVRFTPNPFYVPELRSQSGLDAPVYDYVFSFEQTRDFMDKLRDLMDFLLPLYRAEGKTMLVVAVGCTGGRHRSVAIARALSESLERLGYAVSLYHRDMTRGDTTHG